MQNISQFIAMLELNTLRWWWILLTILVIVWSIFYAILSVIVERKKSNTPLKKKSSPAKVKKTTWWFFDSVTKISQQVFQDNGIEQRWKTEVSDYKESSALQKDVSLEFKDSKKTIPLTEQKPFPEIILPSKESDSATEYEEQSQQDEQWRLPRWKKIISRKSNFSVQNDEDGEDNHDEILEETTVDEIVTNDENNDNTADILMTSDTVDQIEQHNKTKIQREKLKSELEYLKKKQKWDTYESTLIEALAQDHDDTNILEYLADFYMMDNQPKKALSLYKKIIDQQPDNHVFIRKIAQNYIILQDLETAEVLLDNALSLHPKTPKYAMSLVEIYYKNNRMKDSISLMEDIVLWRWENLSYRNTLVGMYEEQWDYEKIVPAYEDMLLIDPTNITLKRKLLEARTKLNS